MKIATYSRVSTEKQEDEKTIESQIADLEKWAIDQGHIIVERYKDEGYSGTLLARPELDRLRDDASKGLFEAVLIHSPDRLARRYVYQEIVIDELKQKGIEVIFLNRPIAETPEDQLLLGVQGIIAEYERGKFLERTRRGRLHRAKSGHILGNIPPYGYDCVKKSESETNYAYYKINKAEARVVRLMFDVLVTQRKTTYGIIIELNELGIKARNGGKWAKSSVAKILRNPTYTGTTYYNKHYGVPSQNNNGSNGEIKYHRRKNTSFRLRPKEEWIPISVPKIIEPEIFEAAQIQLDENSKFSNRHAKLSYLLKGLIKCGKDHRSYYGIPFHGRPFYRCSGKSKLISESGCPSPAISGSFLEPFIWETIKDFISNPRMIIQQFKERQKAITKDTSSIENRLDIIEQELTKLGNQESRFLEAFGSEVITKEQLDEQNRKLQQKREQLNTEKSKVLAQRPNKVMTGNAAQKLKTYLAKVKLALEKFDPIERQQFLRKLLGEILIENRRILMTGVIPPRLNVALSLQPTDERTTGCRQNSNGQVTCDDSTKTDF